MDDFKLHVSATAINMGRRPVTLVGVGMTFNDGQTFAIDADQKAVRLEEKDRKVYLFPVDLIQKHAEEQGWSLPKDIQSVWVRDATDRFYNASWWQLRNIRKPTKSS